MAKTWTGDHFEIAVIGGGATGYAAALTAARSGFETALFAPPARFAPGRTAALLHGSIAMLEHFGRVDAKGKWAKAVTPRNGATQSWVVTLDERA